MRYVRRPSRVVPQRAAQRPRTLLAVVASIGFLALSAAPALAQRPAPEPAPQRTQGPAPEPAPGGTRAPTRRTTTKAATTSEARTPAAPVTVAPLSVAPSSPQVSPPAAPPATAPNRRSRRTAPARRPVKRQSVRAAKKKTARPRVKGQTKTLNLGREAAAAPRAPAVARSADPDSRLLLLGGLALLVLVLGDAVFVALSSRLLRETAEP